MKQSSVDAECLWHLPGPGAQCPMRGNPPLPVVDMVVLLLLITEGMRS